MRSGRRSGQSSVRNVQEIADELVASGAERGLQVAAYVGGEQVVDVVVGVADPATGRPVTAETLFYNWSIGKAATATLVHRLVDDGALGFDTRVVEVWPEFGRHGKDVVTVRQVLDHTTGVPGLPAGVTVDDVCSWSRMTAALEDARLWWEPGTAVGYHAYTFGYLCGEIVRRVTGRELGDVLADLTVDLGRPGEIRYGMADPAGLAVPEDAELGAPVVRAPHRNPPESLGPGHREIWISDPDGYTVVVASPDGEAIEPDPGPGPA